MLIFNKLWLDADHSFSTAVLLTFWTLPFFVYTVGCFVASLESTTRCCYHPTPELWQSKKCVQTLPRISWGNNGPQLRTIALNPYLSSEFSFELCQMSPFFFSLPVPSPSPLSGFCSNVVFSTRPSQTTGGVLEWASLHSWELSFKEICKLGSIHDN